MSRQEAMLDRVRLVDECLARIKVEISELQQDRHDAFAGELADAVVSELRGLETMGVEALVGYLAVNPDPEVRLACVKILDKMLPGDFATDILFSLCTDPNDFVCLPAMDLMGKYRLDYGLKYLLQIVGSPSERFYQSSSPVGQGAAHVLKAIHRILGVSTRDGLMRAEQDFHRNAHVPHRLDSFPADRSIEGPETSFAEYQEMVRVPGGFSVHGLSEEQIPDKMFDWQRSVGSRRIWQPTFLIDRFPVTCAEYDEFSVAVHDHDHIWCHPLEPADKDHDRNTLRDRRTTPNQPVSGVDWLDAWSFATWRGKTLPTEYQWEKAARGPAGTVWPWGDEWKAEAANWFGSNADFSKKFALNDWREILSEVDREFPRVTTVDVGTHPLNASGYGMADVVGNVWEWTRSDLGTGGHFSPSRSLRNSGKSSVVLKGGAWSSLPGQLFPSFRGQDAPACKHNEIGFRCVKQVNPFVLNEWAGTPLTNTGVF